MAAFLWGVFIGLALAPALAVCGLVVLASRRSRRATADVLSEMAMANARGQALRGGRLVETRGRVQ